MPVTNGMVWNPYFSGGTQSPAQKARNSALNKFQIDWSEASRAEGGRSPAEQFDAVKKIGRINARATPDFRSNPAYKEAEWGRAFGLNENKQNAFAPKLEAVAAAAMIPGNAGKDARHQMDNWRMAGKVLPSQEERLEGAIDRQRPGISAAQKQATIQAGTQAQAFAQRGALPQSSGVFLEDIRTNPILQAKAEESLARIRAKNAEPPLQGWNRPSEPPRLRWDGKQDQGGTPANTVPAVPTAPKAPAAPAAPAEPADSVKDKEEKTRLLMGQLGLRPNQSLDDQLENMRAARYSALNPYSDIFGTAWRGANNQQEKDFMKTFGRLLPYNQSKYPDVFGAPGARTPEQLNEDIEAAGGFDSLTSVRFDKNGIPYGPKFLSPGIGNSKGALPTKFYSDTPEAKEQAALRAAASSANQ